MKRSGIVLLIPASDSLQSCWQDCKLSEGGSKRNSPPPPFSIPQQSGLNITQSAQLHISTSVWRFLFFYIQSMLAGKITNCRKMVAILPFSTARVRTYCNTTESGWIYVYTSVLAFAGLYSSTSTHLCETCGRSMCDI